MHWTALLIALLLSCNVLLLLIFWKTRRIDLQTWELDEKLRISADNTYKQLEALAAIYWDVRPTQGLPAMRGWAGSPDFLRQVMNYVRDNKPIKVVECSSGVSTLLLAKTLATNGCGHVWSLENSEEYAEKTRELLNAHGLQDWATVLHAPLVPVVTDRGQQPWYDLHALPQGDIDMLVIDGPPASVASWARYPAGPLLFDRLAEHAGVFLDDASRPDEKEIVHAWVKHHPELQHTNLPCEKGLALLKKR